MTMSNSASPDHSHWSGRTDGLPWMQRSLIALLRVLDVRVLYGVMALVIPGYMLFARRARRAAYAYHRLRRGLGPVAATVGVYRSMYGLGQVVLDRFAAYAGRTFRLDTAGHEAWHALAEAPGGFLQVSSHAGNFELTGYELRSERKPVYALVYGGETETMMRNRERLLARHNIRMVPVAADMAHVFTLSNALQGGAIVSMPGDRLFGSQKAVACPLLGAPARFPLGPFALAVTCGVPAVALFTMKEGAYRYRLLTYRLDDDPSLPARARMERLARAYAAALDDVLGRYPYQWYNFYDFWEA